MASGGLLKRFQNARGIEPQALLQLDWPKLTPLLLASLSSQEERAYITPLQVSVGNRNFSWGVRLLLCSYR